MSGSRGPDAGLAAAATHLQQKVPTPLRVAFVFDNLEFSGAAKVALDIIRSASRDNHHGLVASGFVCMADATNGSCPPGQLEFANPGVSADAPIWRKVFFGLRAVYRCRQAAREVDVLVGVTPPAAFVARCVSWLSGRPVVAWVHYDIRAWQRELAQYSRSRLAKIVEVLFYRWIVPRFDDIAFVSPACLESMEIVAGRRGRQWSCIPNLFSPAGFPGGADAPTVAPLPSIGGDGAPVLLFLGRLSRQKRWEDAIRTVEILQERNCFVHLLVVGDGVERLQFQRRLAESPARTRIHWVGSLPDPTAAYRRADALMLTSLYEAWPVVILEAFHCVVPVISYRCPSGPTEMLADGRGVLSDESPEAMAASVTALLAMPREERAAMTVRAQDFLVRHAAEAVLPLWRAFAVRAIRDREQR